MQPLYKITDSILKLLKRLNHLYDPDDNSEDGAWDIQLQLQQLEMDFDHKVSNIEKHIAHLQAEEAMFRAEGNRMMKRAKIVGNQITWLKDYVANEFKARKIKSAGLDGHRLVMQKSQPKVMVDDESKIAIERPEFMRPVPAQVDKKAILNYFKETGEIVSGVDILVDNYFVKRG